MRNMRELITRAALALSLGALGACNDDPVIPEPDRVLEVKVTPRNAEIEVGTTVNMIAVVSIEGDATTGVSWSSSNQSAATISAEGVAAAQGAGSTQITATSTFDPTK